MSTGNPLIGLFTADSNIITNIANSLLPVQKLISGGCYLLGLIFAFKAISSLRALGESKAMMSSGHSIKEPLVYFLVSAMLLYLPSGMAVLLATTFGSSSILGYSGEGADGVLTSVFGQDSILGQSIVIIIQTIGIIAFVRGWVLVSRASSQGQQPGGTGKGLMHVFGGILAINIVQTLQIINNTLYGV